MELNFKRRSRIKPEIGMTPLIDCAFNLLLFFAVTLNISSQPTGITVKTAAGKTAEAQSPDVTVSIESGGKAIAYYNDTPVFTVGQLRDYVRAEKGDKVTYLVKPEENVPYRKLMSVVDIIRETGGKRAGVSLAMEKETNNEPQETEPENPDQP